MTKYLLHIAKGIVLSLSVLVAQAQETGNSFLNEEVYAVIFDNSTEYHIFQQTTQDSNAVLALLVAGGANLDDTTIRTLIYQLDSITSALAAQKSKFKNTNRWLRWVFDYTQQHYLKHYKAYEPLSLLLTDGVFNCVSGTAFYAIVMQKAGVKYQIKETLSHAYLTVQTENRAYIVESTIPVYGLRRNIKHLEQHLYLENPTDFIQTISLQQLCALQYYNDAVVHFNARQYDKAFKYLVRAGMLYDSQRIAHLLHMTMERSAKDLNKYMPASLAQQLHRLGKK